LPAYTMPRQRPTKLAASRQTEQSSVPEPEEQSDIDSDNESLGILEKDAEEEELDRLVLGDGAGFKAQLGQQMDIDFDAASVNEDSVAEGASEREDDLENVDDAEVRGNSHFCRGRS
jgi:U3 small nucleolar RNA-associated protein 18